jgi:glutaredoxin
VCPVVHGARRNRESNPRGCAHRCDLEPGPGETEGATRAAGLVAVRCVGVSHRTWGERKLEQVQALGLPESCVSSCTRRVQFDDNRKGLSWGYCEGCPSVSRNCPSCKQDKRQTDWGYGWEPVTAVAERAAWVCPDCRADKDTRKLADRFTVDLQVDEVQRYLLADEIRKVPGGFIGQTVLPLVRIVQQPRTAGVGMSSKRLLDGAPTPPADHVALDVDVSDCDESQREATATVLVNVKNQIAPHARDAAETRYYAWASQMPTGKPQEIPPRALREPERSALLHGEKLITEPT